MASVGLLAGERKPSSACSQLGTLLLRKELLLKRTRPVTTICELVLPAALCALLILGVSVSTTDLNPTKEYAPTSVDDAFYSLGPSRLLPLFINNFVAGPLVQSDLPPPSGIPPLGLFFSYSYFATLQTGKALPPYDGTYLAVAVSDPAMKPRVQAMIETVVHNTAVEQLRTLLTENSTSTVAQKIEEEARHFFNVTIYTLDRLLDFPPVEIKVFNSVDELEQVRRHARAPVPCRAPGERARPPLPLARAAASACTHTHTLSARLGGRAHAERDQRRRHLGGGSRGQDARGRRRGRVELPAALQPVLGSVSEAAL